MVVARKHCRIDALDGVASTGSAGSVYQGLGSLFVAGGSCWDSGGSTTETVVSASTATPFTNVGLYRHCSTPLTAEFMRLVGPETYRALMTAPLLPMTTRRTTVPSTRFSETSGYSGETV